MPNKQITHKKKKKTPNSGRECDFDFTWKAIY